MTSLNPDFTTSYFTLNHKTAVITGGTRGLGLHAATGLLLAGCNRIIITSRKANACSSAREALLKLVPADRRNQVEVHAIPADIAKFTEVERFTAEVAKIVGDKGVDIFIANAGASWGEHFDTHPDSAFAKVFDLNVRSVFNCIRLMAPLLQKAGTPSDPSRVITVGSIAGLGIGDTNSQASTFGYNASKAAVIHLTKYLAVELGPRNILCNCVAPGFFPSKMANGVIALAGGKEVLAMQNPNGRLGNPEDFAGLVVFLCTKAASHINGATIPLDGGRHLGSPRRTANL